MERRLVVKVKCGDSLWRFSVSVNEVLGFLDLDMNGLRTRSIGFFNLSPDDDLSFTYVDEDGDVVTLADDNDLRDAAIGQKLNPLRINLQTKAMRTEKRDERSQSENSASEKQFPNQFPCDISAKLQDALKSLPEPFSNSLLKVANDLLSIAVTIAPQANELFKFHKVGSSTTRHDVDASSTCGNLSDRRKDHSNSCVETSNDHPCGANLKKNSLSVEKFPWENHQGHAYATGKTDACMIPSAIGRSPANLTMNLPRENNFKLGSSSATFPVHVGRSVTAVSTSTTDVNHLMDLDNPSYNRASEFAEMAIPKTHDKAYIMANGKGKQSIHDLQHTASKGGFYSHKYSAFDNVIGANIPDVAYPTRYDYKIGNCDETGRTFHGRIQCDGCGMLPIMGPRFKSKVNHDYDLCSICFSRIGNEADYSRIDRGSSMLPIPSIMHPQSHIPSFGIRDAKKQLPKLSSCFVEDVTVPDGTRIAPNTRFTKIWRVHNDGTILWPKGTRLVWVGGNLPADKVSVEVEIPAKGFPVNEELDIAVEFEAPSDSGHYMSYWRLACPAGQMFGQGVWALIEVDPGLCSLSDSLRSDLNLNLPPEIDEQRGKQIVDINEKPIDDGRYIVCSSSSPVVVTYESVNPSSDMRFSGNELIDFQADNGNYVGGNGVPVPPVSYPIIDLSEPAPAVGMQAPRKAGEVEQTLLKQLEEMGFKQTELSREVLRKNDYVLEQSVDDLCGLAEWEPILTELQDMGFTDVHMNKELLVKNGGSIKKVVMELIAGEKKAS